METIVIASQAPTSDPLLSLPLLVAARARVGRRASVRNSTATVRLAAADGLILDSDIVDLMFPHGYVNTLLEAPSPDLLSHHIIFSSSHAPSCRYIF